MSNGTQLDCQVEIAPLADDLVLNMQCVITEDAVGGDPATQIVLGDETYFVQVTWTLEGQLARHFCGEWLLKVDLESIGDAPNFSTALETIPMDPCKEDEYSHTFTIGPGDLQPAQGGTVYIPAVTLSTLDPCGDAGHLWGHCTGPSVMFTSSSPEPHT